MLNIDIERLAIYRIGMEKGIEKGVKKGEAIGERKGERKRSLTIAKNLLGMGMDLPQIAAATGLSPEEIEALANDHSKQNG